MRHLYVCPLETWREAHNLCLFNPGAGSHYINLPDGLVIVAAVLNEACEEAFKAMPGVAALPDSVFNGGVTLADHRDNPATAYLAEHHEALKVLGIEDTDTVLEVSNKTRAIHPLVKLAHIV